MRRITGTPRNTSTNTAASSRTGNSAAARLVRTSATTSPTISTATSITQNILMSSQNADSTSGNESLNALQEKNVSRTLAHPGLVTASATRPPMTITDEAAATAWPLRARRRFEASRSARRPAVATLADTREMLATRSAAESRPPPTATAQSLGATKRRRVGRLVHPAVLDLLELAGGTKPVDRVGHACGERRVLREQRAPLVAPGGGELSDDGRIGNLGRRDVQGRGQVGDDRVHEVL